MNTGGAGGAGGGTDVCTGCGPNQLCDPMLGCVECLTSNDCPMMGQPICFFGSCEECGTTADCGLMEYCHPTDHTCQPGCITSADCDNGDANICDPNGACVECLQPNDCPDNPLCNTDLGICADCILDGDCGAAQPHCQVDAGRCRECLIDTHCDPGFACVGHNCVPECASSADCTNGNLPVCDTAIGVCVECTMNGDCTNPDLPVCSGGNECVACATNAECLDTPATPLCSPQQDCVECLSNTDCLVTVTTPFCSEDFTCVECLNDQDCGPNGNCNNFSCQ